jgi:spore coat polysaccharide biosynthesis protein SpsF
MKIGFLITARLKSTRLPKKLLLKIFDREIIRWMIDRLKLVEELDEIVICTSTNPQDNRLEIIANEENIKVFRGDEEDVLARLLGAANQFNLDYIVNVTADCPLVSIKYIKEVINKYSETNADLITCLKLPIGSFCYGIKPSALKKVCEIKNSSNTEVWGKYFIETGLFDVIDLEIPEPLVRDSYRLTLDYPEDFQLIEGIFKHFGDAAFKTDIGDIIRFLDENPKISNINSNCQELYEKRWKSQSDIALK